MVLARKVIRREGRGLDALDVPGMKILVTDQPQEGLVAIGRFRAARHRKIVARCHQCGRGAMLQAAVAISGQHGHEHIAVGAVQKGGTVRLWFEKAYLRLANSAHIAGDPP